MAASARAKVKGTVLVVAALVVAALCSACIRHSAVGGAGQGEDVSRSPYANWSNGPSSDPDYFPIGVWVQDPKNAVRYRAAGINLYVSLWQGPTEAQLAELSTAGMRVICRQNEVGLAHLDDPVIAGWMHGDEPDNAQRQADGSWAGPVPTEIIVANYPTNPRQRSDTASVVESGAGRG